MEAAYSKEELRQRVRWYIGIRWFFVLVIGLSGSLPQLLQEGLVDQVMLNFAIVGIMLAVNGLFLLASSFRSLPYRAFQALAVAQLVFDTAIITGAIYFNGGIENIIFCLYVIPIVMSGALLGRFAVYATGLASAALYDLLILYDYLGKIHPQNVLAPQVHGDTNYVVQTLFIAPAMLLTITAITDFVARLIRERSDLAARLHVVTAEQARSQAILQSMGSGLVAIDPKGRIELVNESFEKLTSWKSQEVLGRDINDIVPLLNENGQPIEATDRPLLKMVAQLPRQHGPNVEHLSQFYMARKDGSTFPFVSAVSQIVLNGRVIGALSVFDDATSSKKIEQLKTNFVALASHQLKTPLGEIQGYTRNMIDGITGRPTPKQLAYLRAIEDVAARCLKLVSDLLDISVVERGNLLLDRQPVALQPIIEQAADIYRERIKAKGMKLKLVPAAKPLTVVADADKLVEVIGNLLTNALRYTRPRSTISVETRADKRYAQVLVKDRGPGMSPKLIESIFERDDSLTAAPQAEGGTGVGLYLAKQLMLLQKGDISVLSSTDKGTTIAIKIPLEGES